MSRRLIVVSAVGLLFALTLMMSAASMAQERQGGSGADLSSEQRERFIEGAREVAGLSEDEISAALKDPAAIEAVPVIEKERLQSPGGAARDAAESEDRCSTMSASRSYYNVRRQELFSFGGLKKWCFDYVSKVTSAPDAKRNYRITALGERNGWRFVSVIRRRDAFARHDGFPRGSHVSRIVLRFKSCDENNENCFSVYPQYRGVGYYDGTGFQRTKTLNKSPNR